MNDPSFCDSILKSNGLRPEQKLAIAVLKLSLEDIKAALPLKSGAWKDNEDLSSAMKLLLSDVDSLEFWCTIAGWDWKTVRECAKRLSWGRDVKLVPKVGRPKMADDVVKPGTLYWREWYKRRKK